MATGPAPLGWGEGSRQGDEPRPWPELCNLASDMHLAHRPAGYYILAIFWLPKEVVALAFPWRSPPVCDRLSVSGVVGTLEKLGDKTKGGGGDDGGRQKGALAGEPQATRHAGVRACKTSARLTNTETEAQAEVSSPGAQVRARARNSGCPCLQKDNARARFRESFPRPSLLAGWPQ